MRFVKRFGVFVVVLALPALAPAADAATLSRDGNTIVFTDTAANFTNEVFVYKLTGSDEIFIGDEQTPTLTDAGFARVEEVAPLHVAQVREVFFDRLSSEQVQQLREIFEAVGGPLADETGCPPPACD